MFVVNIYTMAYIVHFYCAAVFVGGVFFEMLILLVTHIKRVSREAWREVEQAMSYRAVRVMSPVVAILFLSGLVMVFDRYIDTLRQPLASLFGALLTLKILLVFSVLVHLTIVVVKMHRRTLTVNWSEYIHVIVFTHMSFITLLAKGMFYFSW